MGTKQSVKMTNPHKNNIVTSYQLTYMTIDKPGGHQNLKIRRPLKQGKELKHYITLSSFRGAHQNQ